MAHQARGAFLERMVPLALQDHQGQLAFLELLESRGSLEAQDHKAHLGHLVSLVQRESEESAVTCSPKPW